MTNDDMRPDAATSESSPAGGEAVTVVSALMEERRRFEGWIAALEARRATTTKHVFERVHLDYTSRLEAVIVQLGSHADALRGEMESLATRLGALTAEHQGAVDQRDEAEVRAGVGELSADDWARSSAASDATLADLTMRRGEVEQELARTRELLDSTVRPSPTSAPAVPERGPDAAPVVATTAPAPPVVTPPAAPAESVDAAPPMELSASVIAAEQKLIEIEEAAVPPTPPAPVAPRAPMVPLASMPETDVPSHMPRRSQGFDELAFLSSVVDTPSGAFEAAPADEPDEKSRQDRFARRSQEDSIVHLADGTTPLGTPVIQKEADSLHVTGGRSAIRRDSLSDGVKSLKCGECGAMNYPTEWYCERCGAELASL
ncbi:MAG: Ran-binding zinc finger domain-containing protein [bacterium]